MALGQVIIVGAPWTLRQGVRQTLKQLGLVIVGEGDTLDEASAKMPDAIEPSIIFVIAGQGEQPAVALAEANKAKQTYESAKLAILSESALAEEVAAALRAGADALLSLQLPSRMLGHSLQLVMLGQKLFPALPACEQGVEWAVAAEPAVAAAPPPLVPAEPPHLAVVAPVAASQVIQIAGHVHPARPHGSSASLVWDNTRPEVAGPVRPAVPSDREWEILRCLSSGSSNKAIARELSIAETTVKVHIKSLLRKLAVSNRTQAAIWALNHGGNVGAQAKPAPAHLNKEPTGAPSPCKLG